jgi:hypothetical protein
MADSKLDTAFFDGKVQNFTFKSYTGLLNNASADIEGTGETVSETQKVQVFLNGLKDPRLEVAKAAMIASPTLKATFEQAVNYCAQFLDTARSLRNSQQAGRAIGQVRRDAQGQGRGSTQACGGRNTGRGRIQAGRNHGRGRGTRTTGLDQLYM